MPRRERSEADEGRVQSADEADLSAAYGRSASAEEIPAPENETYHALYEREQELLNPPMANPEE